MTVNGVDAAFWRGRRVLLTGHTGFKGSWLALWLQEMGADVTGLALPPEGDEALFNQLVPWDGLRHRIADLRDAAAVAAVVEEAQPEIILHLAAQALVRVGYADPVATFAANVMGTAHLLEAARRIDGLKAVVVVTSDKVYANAATGRAFTEDDALGGHEPYGASKACTEHVAAVWRESFLGPRGVHLATARAGNVIGGGDWGRDRLLPDIFRALAAGTTLRLRYPNAIRPWQFMLEPLRGYLMLAERLVKGGGDMPRAVNFGPDEHSVTVGDMVARIHALWGRGKIEMEPPPFPPEAPVLRLDAAAAADLAGWTPALTLDRTLDWTGAWYRAALDGADMRSFSRNQLNTYRGLFL